MQILSFVIFVALTVYIRLVESKMKNLRAKTFMERLVVVILIDFFCHNMQAFMYYCTMQCTIVLYMCYTIIDCEHVNIRRVRCPMGTYGPI